MTTAADVPPIGQELKNNPYIKLALSGKDDFTEAMR